MDVGADWEVDALVAMALVVSCLWVRWRHEAGERGGMGMLDGLMIANLLAVDVALVN